MLGVLGLQGFQAFFSVLGNLGFRALGFVGVGVYGSGVSVLWIVFGAS